MTTIADSGTGALTGLNGVLKLTIVDGKHLYELHHSLLP